MDYMVYFDEEDEGFEMGIQAACQTFKCGTTSQQETIRGSFNDSGDCDNISCGLSSVTVWCTNSFI